MKKPLVIAFAVLVPFVGLVVWGLTRPAAEVTPVELSALGGPVARVEPMSPPAPVPTPIAVPVAQPEPTPTPTVAPGSIDARTDPAHLAALASMRPLVDRCFTEHAADLAGRVRVRMNFVVTPDGQVSKPQLKVSTQNPYLQACLDDMVASAHVDISQGVPVGAVRGDFDFDPALKKP